MSDTVVLSKWVLASGRVMPQLPDWLAYKLVTSVAWGDAMPIELTEPELREAVETVTKHMLRELGLIGAGK